MRVKVYGFALVIKSGNKSYENGNVRRFYGELINVPFEEQVDPSDGHHYSRDFADFDHNGGIYQVCRQQCRIIVKRERDITDEDCER